MKNKTNETRLINGMFSINRICNCFEFKVITDKNWTHNPPIEEFYDLTLIIDGQATFYIKNKKYNVKRGDIFFKNRNNDFHSKGSIGFHHLSIRFCVGKEDRINFLKKLYHIDNIDYYYNLFSEAIRLYDQKSYMYNIKITSIIYNIVASLITSEVSKENSHNKYRIIKNSVIYMNDNIYNPNLSVEDIAEKSNISVKHFRNIFKEIYEITPVKYITEKRLEKGKELLYYSEYSINEIAEYVGFNSTIYFDRVFKKYYGSSPMNYKNSI